MNDHAQIPLPQRSRGIDPDMETMRQLAHQAVDLVLDHLSTLSQQPVTTTTPAEAVVRSLSESLPEHAIDPASSLQRLADLVLPEMTRVNHPRFHAFLPAPGSFFGWLGETIGAGVNPFVGSWLGGRSFSVLEQQVLQWIGQGIGYPGDGHGILTSGGSMANLAGLACARARRSEEEEARAVIYFSDQVHNSAIKAARILGFRSSLLRTIPSRDDFTFDVDALRNGIQADRAAGLLPTAVCASAGTTNTGAIDPLSEIAVVCQEHDLWLHVDGAYGGFAALADSHAFLREQLALADSLTLDPHKWLYAPMGIGCLLVRRRADLARAFSSAGDYLRDVSRAELNYFDFGPELSRPSRALPLWMLLRSLGRRRLQAEIEEDLRLASWVARRVTEHPDLELVAPVPLSVVCLRVCGRHQEAVESIDRRNQELINLALADGRAMFSSTVLRGRPVLRFVIMNHRTDAHEVEHSLRVLFELVDRVR